MKRIRERGGEVRAPNSNAMKVFEITGLTRVFAIS